MEHYKNVSLTQTLYIPSEEVVRTCSVKKVFLEISKNSPEPETLF